jgi:general stress protein 26
MSLAKRSGPDFLFLTNANSTKCQDLAASPDVSLTFHDPAGKQDWVSVTGRATTTCTGDDDPRVQEVYSRGVAAWFGDLGDGVHDGGPRDPRVVLVEVQSRCE